MYLPHKVVHYGPAEALTVVAEIIHLGSIDKRDFFFPVSLCECWCSKASLWWVVSVTSCDGGVSTIPEPAGPGPPPDDYGRPSINNYTR